MQEDFYLRSASLAMGIKCLVGWANGFGKEPYDPSGCIEEAALTGVSSNGSLFWDDYKLVSYFYHDSVWKSCDYPYKPIEGAIRDFLEEKRALL